jgi:dihydrolipoamide dehydrogenase
MKKYDVIVIGAGEGSGIAFKAAGKGFRTALIEKGDVGGTCLNVGCIPSKTLLFPADRIMEIKEAAKLGVRAGITKIDFAFIMNRMRKAVTTGRNFLKKAIEETGNLDFYNKEARFSDKYVLDISGEKIRGDKIFIASGSRPVVPPIKGLDRIDYLTNESVLKLKQLPASIVIVGGGYVGVEYAHFFAAMGARVTVVEPGKRLVSHEEPEISDLLKKKLEKRMAIHMDSGVLEVKKNRGKYVVIVREKRSRRKKEIHAREIMVAAGRRSNADILNVRAAGIETDRNGYIKVDAYLRTSRKNIWACGDALGRQMFTHAADREAEIVWHNAAGTGQMKMDFDVVPHVVFSYPQIASVGLTESAAKKDYRILAGKARYSDIVTGDTMAEESGFAKAVVEKTTHKILGFHIIGPYASCIIQEVVNAMANNQRLESITAPMHAFPTLPELIPEVLSRLE